MSDVERLWNALHEWREAFAESEGLSGTDFSEAAAAADRRVMAAIRRVESLFAQLSGGGSPPPDKYVTEAEPGQVAYDSGKWYSGKAASQICLNVKAVAGAWLRGRAEPGEGQKEPCDRCGGQTDPGGATCPDCQGEGWQWVETCIHCGKPKSEHAYGDLRCRVVRHFRAAEPGEGSTQRTGGERLTDEEPVSPIEQMCPLCVTSGVDSTVHLNERFGSGNAGLYLASYWCSSGHEWSVRSKPWGNEQRALLRQARQAMQAATEGEDA
jgi:hypothetical protein